MQLLAEGLKNRSFCFFFQKEALLFTFYILLSGYG